jgi:hypothetical protein
MGYRVAWYQSGTGYSLMAGPFKTREEAEEEPYSRSYPPERRSIVVWEVPDAQVSE